MQFDILDFLCLFGDCTQGCCIVEDTIGLLDEDTIGLDLIIFFMCTKTARWEYSVGIHN